MALRLATTAALVTGAAATINLAIQDCGDASTHGHVSGISPSSVEQGKATVVSGAGHIDTTVADGSFNIDVKAAGVTVTSCKGDICAASKCALPEGAGSVDFHGVACPLAAGDVSLDFDVFVSEFVPSSLAHLDVEISAEGSAGKLLCAKLSTSPAAAMSASQDHPHLAQAWQANSVGDGLQGTTGLESYIFEDCKKRSETCMAGHIFNYGEDTCVKYEVDMGVHSQYTGTYYVKCDSVNCCKGDKFPDIKQWDIGQGKKSTITHLGVNDIQDLDGPVAGADTWNEIDKIPFTPVSVNYTYYITQSGNDTISHRIDFSEPGDTHAQNGQILYGNFIVKHAEDLDAFREVFKAPAECLKPNTLTCPQADIDKWEGKFFRGRHGFGGKATGTYPVAV